MSEIRDLVVFKRLRIHALTVERRRVKATYSLEKMDGSIYSTDLIYSYESPFFDPKSPADRNLASMMLAQVALNYGLFFQVIEFEGLFDQHDRRFLTDMCENTSKEIFVNKFLSPNEFIKPPFNQMEARQMERYTAAELVFTGEKYERTETAQTAAGFDPTQFAILSSGGKDSLLSYGLVRELGVAHPVFINESGRHWFTAVNAYRHLHETEPNTVKPWCNSDRLFNWMLRHIPFIREDFANVRADIYPIRLWTVAVFLFGTLPVVLKRKIGNVLIGNEYDTTVVSQFKGITHYNALFDQSRYFDNALTRYYAKKGWDIRQSSLIRSLSELLIMKVLVKRYPDLQKHQVSCHAAHDEEGRMHPCGKCEKCNRIIGMLRALDEDPRRCGYHPEQIAEALRALDTKKVKQIGSDAAHLYFLLRERNLISAGSANAKLGKAHPEIMHLRFDNERSRPEELPPGIHEQLLRIFGEYAEGTVNLQNRHWIREGDGKQIH